MKYPSKKRIPKIILHLALILMLNLFGNLTSLAQEPNSLIPFVLPWDDNSSNLTNMSSLIEKPAGKYGFIKVKNGHLYSGDNRIRFLGTNLAFDAVFPSHCDAEKISAHLARLGINCVRFHHFDSQIPPKGLLKEDRVTMDPDQLDKLDYFIYQLKINGIYTDLNTHVGRIYPDMPVWQSMPPQFKGTDLFYSPMIQLQKDYTKALLTHYNPYTNNTYGNEPAIALVEINNEDSLIYEWTQGTILNDLTPNIYKDEFEKQWNNWLQNKYQPKPDEQYSKVKIIPKASFKDQKPLMQKDWLDFLYFTENNYWTSMYSYIKNDLNSHNLVIGTQNYASPYSLQSNMDVIDNHAYWQHPRFPHKRWDPDDWIVKNISMAGLPGGEAISKMALSRVVGKPFVITEYNHPSPNTYSSEAFPLISAYAAFQDWDGIFSFEYTNSSDWDIKKIRGCFDIDQNPTKLVTMIPSFIMLTRGDIKTSDDKKTVYASYDEIRNAISKYGYNISADKVGIKPSMALKYPIGLSLEPLQSASKTNVSLKNSTNNTIESITKELVWDETPKKGVVTVNTSMSKAVIGSTAKKDFILNDVEIRFKNNMQDWATLTLTKFGKFGFNTGGNILITATGYEENTNMIWKDSTKASVGTNWGEAPSLVEGIPADIILPVRYKKVSAWALDERGNRKTKINASKDKGKTIITIGPEYKTLWYEVEIK